MVTWALVCALFYRTGWLKAIVIGVVAWLLFWLVSWLVAMIFN